jgi:dTDP-4-dehydrorhamnose reductase
MAKVVVIGATGGLGSDCVKAFAADGVVGLGHADVEITDKASIERMLDTHQPKVVVNTAAFHNVPKCETEPESAYRVNAIAPRLLAQACGPRGARLVHVSTDYVFDGAKSIPYVETDCPNPLNVYAQSKLAGEYGVLSVDGGHQVVRSSGLYGLQPCRAKGGNFIDTMYKVAAEKPEVRVVADEILTPTFNADLAEQIRVIAFEGAGGLYHATNSGQCSWYEFAKTIFELGKFTTPLLPTSVKEFAAPVKRPFYSVLDNAHLRAQGLDRMRPWKEALADYMRQRLAA